MVDTGKNRMIWKNNKPRAIIFFSLLFFISYIVIFLLLYASFPFLQKHAILPLLRVEVATLDPSSQIQKLIPLKKSLQGNIHFEIALLRHPEGDPAKEQGVLILQANFSLRDNILQLCLMLALALSWPGLSLFKRLEALATVLLSWLCFFSLQFPFAILNDGIPPLGIRLTLINWWNIFLTHKGNALLTLLFFLGNMYRMYLMGAKKQQ